MPKETLKNQYFLMRTKTAAQKILACGFCSLKE